MKTFVKNLQLSLLLTLSILSFELLISQDLKELSPEPIEEHAEGFAELGSEELSEQIALIIEESDTYFKNFSEAYDYVRFTAELMKIPLTDEENCNQAYRQFKKTKCKVPRKRFAKQVVKIVGNASFSTNDGVITTPNFTIFKNEVNRLNLILEAFYNQQLEFCNKMSICNNAEFTINCNAINGKPIPKVVEERYRLCGELLKDYDTNELITSLSEMGNILNKFQDGSISTDSTKTLVGVVLKKLEKDQ